MTALADAAVDPRAWLARARHTATRTDPHHIAWVITDDVVTGTITCRAGEAAACRLSCTAGCGTWTEGAEGGCDTLGHPIAAGPCRAARWFSATTLAECHAELREPLRDGPVDVWWDGDTWLWAYTDPPRDDLGAALDAVAAALALADGWGNVKVGRKSEYRALPAAGGILRERVAEALAGGAR